MNRKTDICTSNKSKQDINKMVFTAFDFETTGLSPLNDKIIEIGAVKFSNGEILEKFEHLINPEMVIPKRATMVNGISTSDIKDKPVITKILPKFIKFIGSSILIAHNAGFDLSFLDAAISEAGLEPVRNLVLDTCNIARKVYKGRKSHSLQDLAIDLKIEVESAHRALDDSRVCMHLFLKSISRLSEKQIPDIGTLLNLSGIRRKK